MKHLILILSLCFATVMISSCEKEILNTTSIDQEVSKEAYVNNFMSNIADLP